MSTGEPIFPSTSALDFQQNCIDKHEMKSKETNEKPVQQQSRNLSETWAASFRPRRTLDPPASLRCSSDLGKKIGSKWNIYTRASHFFFLQTRATSDKEQGFFFETDTRLAIASVFDPKAGQERALLRGAWL